jgi:DNA repair exonuclease SbcCD ATPase subunit
MKNFMSYGNVPTIVLLDRPGTTLILGENLDNTTSGMGSNGVGKTTVINALTYALYDTPISKISKDKLINNINNKNMEVVVVFEKDGIEYKITRARKAGAEGNYTKIAIGGVEDREVAGSRDINKEIENILGIPYDLFVRIATFSADLDAFFDLPSRHATATNQTDLIEELFNLKTLSEKAEVLKEQMSDTEQSMVTNLAKIEALKKEQDRHNQQLAQMQSRVVGWGVDRDRNLKELRAKLERIKNINVEEQQALIEQSTEINSQLRAIQTKETEIRTEISKLTAEKRKIQYEIGTIESNLKKIEGIDVDQQHALNQEFTTLTSELREIDRARQTVEKEIKTLAKDSKTITQELEHLNEAKCPYCKQRFESEEKLLELREKIKQVQTTLTEKEALLETTNQEVGVLTTKMAEVKRQITVSDFTELLDIKSKLGTYQTQLQTLQNTDVDTRIAEKQEVLGDVTIALGELKQQSVEVKADYTTPQLMDIKSQVEVCQQKIAELEVATNPYVDTLKELEAYTVEPVDMSVVNELQATTDHQKFLLKLLTKKDSFVRKTLLNKSIPYLNQRLAHYLTELGLPHTVEFTPDMSAEISQFGKPLDFGNLSKGQRARVNVALSFAFRDVFQSMSNHINICMLDEVLDLGLDGVGVQNAARMLKRKTRDEGLSMFIISHRDEIDSAFDRKMIIQMSNGFSYVKYEEG